MNNWKEIRFFGLLIFTLAGSCVYSDLVLIMGDSISIAYTPYAQLYAGSRHEIIHSGINATTSGNGVLNIIDWLETPNGNREWDVIQFNHGLHDISRSVDNTSPPQTHIGDYVTNLQSITAAIQAHSPRATIIFALTTPVMPVNTGNRIPEDVYAYNEAAVGAIGSDVFINNLYFPMLSHLEDWSTDGTHFSAEGNQFNGIQVVNFIDSVIPEPRTIALIFCTAGILLLRRCKTGKDIYPSIKTSRTIDFLNIEKFSRPLKTIYTQCWEFES
jgi:hypothetical protein